MDSVATMTERGSGARSATGADAVCTTESDVYMSGRAAAQCRSAIANVGARLGLLALAVLGGWTFNSQAFVPLTGVSAIAAGSGSFHTCALIVGSAKCWGDNSGGQLGDGSTTPSLTPIQVSGLTSGVIGVAVGNSHTCALITGGSVKCWGTNSTGQLGDGSIAPHLTPAAVTGIASGATAIVAGAAHTCALVSGGVKCWGANSAGQLGDNSTMQRLAPVAVSGLASGVVAIAAGQFHTCAVTSAGLVKCWGSNASGQIGDNSIMTRQAPVNVSGIASGATAVAAGNLHTCALVSGGVKCWGSNVSGQIGDNSLTQRLTPVDVVGLTSGVTAIVTGYAHSCARLSGTGIQCWGNNVHGELGDGTLVGPRQVPVDVTGMTSGVTAVTAQTRMRRTSCLLFT